MTVKDFNKMTTEIEQVANQYGYKVGFATVDGDDSRIAIALEKLVSGDQE